MKEKIMLNEIMFVGKGILRPIAQNRRKLALEWKINVFLYLKKKISNAY